MTTQQQAKIKELEAAELKLWDAHMMTRKVCEDTTNKTRSEWVKAHQELAAARKESEHYE